MQDQYWPTDQWETAENQQFDGLNRLIKDQYGNTTGIVVLKSGRIAYEQYFSGSTPDSPVHVASVTKSVLSALVGIAIDKGHIQSPEQRVLDFFPEHTPVSALQSRITIRHLMTMTAPYAFPDWQEPFDKLCTSPNWVDYILGILGEGGELGNFKYSTSGAHLLSALLTRATGENTCRFANRWLFAPTGMRQLPDAPMEAFGFEELFGAKLKNWASDPQGNTTGGWGLTMTVRDMARFGLLYTRRGRWNDMQVVPEAWVECTTAANGTPYGWLWWLKEGAHLAMGDGGNVICCIPEGDIVVAIGGAFIPNASDRWPLIAQHILPRLL